MIITFIKIFLHRPISLSKIFSSFQLDLEILFKANSKLSVELGIDHTSLYNMDFYEYSIHLNNLKDKQGDTKYNSEIKVDLYKKDKFIEASDL